MTDLAKAHALVVRLRSGDPRANFWKICADTIEAQASEIERLRAPALPSDRLIDALAECIVARQGLPNRDRAKAVLAVIEAQGWRLVPPKEKP